jgi:2-polyprenyl-3-methyl-5-hydroxy-6-metoxy-1,4-benzoquinol methylase
MVEGEKRELVDMVVKPEGYYSNRRLEMVSFIPKTASKILDCGCGEGFFAEEVQLQFPDAEVWGLELDSESAETARKKIHTVLQGDLDATISQLPENYFDCISFNDVLEHLVNPYEILTRLRKNLTANGVIICSIPNVRYWRVFKKYVFGKNFRYEDNGVMDRTHLRFFTKRSIEEMFQDLGFSILEMKGLKPTPSVGFHIANALTLGSIKDCKYIQYACVVKPLKQK